MKKGRRTLWSLYRDSILAVPSGCSIVSEPIVSTSYNDEHLASIERRACHERYIQGGSRKSSLSIQNCVEYGKCFIRTKWLDSVEAKR